MIVSIKLTIPYLLNIDQVSISGPIELVEIETESFDKSANLQSFID